MAPSSISRGPITSRLLDELVTEGFPVGDNAAPGVPFGWQGEPNAPGTTFTPWMSLSPGAAIAAGPAGDRRQPVRLATGLCRGLLRDLPEADRGVGGPDADEPDEHRQGVRGNTDRGLADPEGHLHRDWEHEPDRLRLSGLLHTGRLVRGLGHEGIGHVRAASEGHQPDGDEAFVLASSVDAYERNGWTAEDDGSSEESSKTTAKKTTSSKEG